MNVLIVSMVRNRIKDADRWYKRGFLMSEDLLDRLNNSEEKDNKGHQTIKKINLGGEDERCDKLFDMSCLLQNHCRERALPIFNHTKTTQIILRNYM